MKGLKISVCLLTVAAMVLALLSCRGEEGEGEQEGTQPVSQLPSSPQSLVERGQAVYDETGCATCHAAPGTGPSIGPVLKDLVKKFSDQDLRRILRDPRTLNPNTTMPPFEGTEEELSALIVYLKTLK